MKKRRTDASSGLEDVERTLHTSFCSAANSISQLYTQAQHQHKIAFQAGQRHGLEKLCEWIQKQQHQCGVIPSTADVLNYLKNELENLGQNEMSISQVQNPVLPSQYQLAPPNPFGRNGSTPDQQRFPPAFPQSFFTG